ncbi:hypothetical protein D3C86_1611500 [compost metagenome]
MHLCEQVGRGGIRCFQFFAEQGDDKIRFPCLVDGMDPFGSKFDSLVRRRDLGVCATLDVPNAKVTVPACPPGERTAEFALHGV